MDPAPLIQEARTIIAQQIDTLRREGKTENARSLLKALNKIDTVNRIQKGS